MRKFLVIMVVAFGWNMANGQYSNRQCQWIANFDQPIVLDSLSVEPGSIETSIPAEFVFDMNTNSLVLQSIPGVDSINVCYRSFPFNFTASQATHTLQEYDSTVASKPLIIPNAYDLTQREELFSVNGIQKTGSISRGVSFGSNQDVFVNSALNLQMEGKLSEDLNIRAVITDQNIPFQPEGNTQQLQDFDNVYIQLYNDKFNITAGDVVLKSKPSEFLKYYKNVQGGQGVLKYNLTDQLKGESSAAFSVAKGRFASTQVEAIEGVAGPYKLRGPDGERFIIVLANSERVFVDGKLLERGFDHDYIIDYNLAEVTFTNKIVITRFSRIRIDFEFSDRNYNRSIFKTSHYFESKKTDFHFNFYQEKDNRNQPLSFDLSNEDKLALSLIGDDIGNAFISGSDSVGFNENLILYKSIDTVDLAGQPQRIFKFSTSRDSAKFSVTFAEVGQGNGDYVLLNTTTNGRVYQWSSPVNGLPQGRFAPLTPITTPSMKQMMTLGGGYKLSATDKIFTEIALSNHNLNLYSDLDNGDNQGYALKVGYLKDAVPVKILPGYKVSGSIDYEYDQENFKGIDRFRYIEFNRDWGVSGNTIDPVADNILNGTVLVTADKLNQLSYRYSTRKRGNQVDGSQHSLKGSKSIGKIQLNSELFLLNNDQSIQQTEWKRWSGETYYRSKYIQPGYQYSSDRNKVVSTLSGDVISTAMNFNEHMIFLRNGDSLKTRFNINYALREDRLPLNGELTDNNRSHTSNLLLGKTIKDNHNIDMTFTYRNLKNLNATNDEDRNEETIMGRLDWTGAFLDDHLRTEMTYATNNSRELRREFVFLQVNTGEGTHAWRDLNADGVQDLGEFFEAINADERTYVKIFVPTDDFILAFSNLFNYRLSTDMPRSWRGEGGIKSLLARFSNVTAINLDKKITDESIGARFFPFSGNINDDDIIAIRQSIRSTFFFNRASPGYAMDFGVRLTEGKQLLTNGIESRNNDEYNLSLRYNLDQNYNFTVRMLKGRKSNFSDFLEGRNYLINTRRIGPEIAWQPSNRFRLSTGYVLTNKKNIFSENQGEEIFSNEFRLDMRVTKASKSSMNATFRYIVNDFNGDENTALGYELLDALRPGKNATWNLNLQRKLANGLRITMNYEGRTSADQRVIHIGRMQVTALF